MKFLLTFASMLGALSIQLQAKPVINMVNNLGNGYYNVWWRDAVTNEGGTTCYEGTATNNNDLGCWVGVVTCRTTGRQIIHFNQPIPDETEETPSPFMRFFYHQPDEGNGHFECCDILTSAVGTKLTCTFEFANQSDQELFCNQPYWPLVHQIVIDILEYHFNSKKPTVFR